MTPLSQPRSEPEAGRPEPADAPELGTFRLKVPWSHPRQGPVPSRLVHGRNPSIAGPDWGTVAVDDPLEHRVQVQALVDAQTGLAQSPMG